LDADADIEGVEERESRTPLMEAAWDGHTEVVRLLLERGARANAVARSGGSMNITALHAATKHGHADVVDLLLVEGVDVNVNARDTQEETPLFKAAGLPLSRRQSKSSGEDDSTRIVRALLKAGAGVSAGDHHGITPLMRAASAGCVANVRLLLDAGADPNAETDRFTHGGKTPLMYAAERGRADVLEVLLEAGAEVNAQSSHGTTALIEGARRGGRNTVRVLLDAGADPNMDARDQGTAVTVAAAGHHIDLVRELLERGAAVPDRAIEEAEAIGDTEMAALLRSYQTSPAAAGDVP
jgi:ankyrin repeat protein